MASRALIIAIEEYASATADLARSLPGTLDAGLAFRTWLVDKWAGEGRAQADTQVVFCSEPRVADGRGASRDDIIDVLDQLKQEGQSATEELFFFFSGHGFSFVASNDKRADVIIAGDYVRAKNSGPSCFLLEEIASWSRAHLGFGRHYFFVDACRNHLSTDVVQVGKQLTWAPQASGEASTFILQSTEDGAVAMVGGAFPKELLAGLRGKGKAKIWREGTGNAMFVRYDSLRGYLKARLKKQQIYSRVEGLDGESDGVLAVLQPVPRSKCTIQIADAPVPLLGEIAYTRGRSSAETVTPITSARIELPLEPDVYQIKLRLTGGQVAPPDVVPADLYEDCELSFRAGPAPGSSPAPPPGPLEGNLAVAVPPSGGIDLHNLSTGETTRLTVSADMRLPQGRYLAVARSEDKYLFKREEIDVVAGESASLAVSDWRASGPHAAIAKFLPHSNDAVDFSESLGMPVTDPDLDLWLALLGGGRILGSTGDYSKISQFPLHDFSREAAGASPIYVLAGLNDVGAELQVAISRDANVTWNKTTQPPDMPGIRDAYFEPSGARSHLISVRVEGGVPYTFVTHTSFNRAMLITLTFDEEGVPRIAQYLLPIGHLLRELNPDVYNRTKDRNHLRDVRFLARASRAFRKRRDLVRTLGESDLDELLYAKWLDPIASSLAAYENVRRGRKSDIGEVVSNMKKYFADLPDTWALAKLAGEDIPRPSAPPLFFDGLRAFPNFEEWLPLPVSHLDFASSWTAWRAAVKA